MKVAIVGIGCVGSAILKDFTEKSINVVAYDKFKNGGIGRLEDTLLCDILFLCLPTMYSEKLKEYNKTSLIEVCTELSIYKYKGLVVIKSTIEPETTQKCSETFNLNFAHNPEFLSANTAYEDFKNQDHIVLGHPYNTDESILQPLIDFYSTYYPNAKQSILHSTESELMKISVNNFYSVKIQFFNEIYLLSENLGISYDKVKDTMLKNNWINQMHTNVPGTDGKLSYGGMCFPKDTNALNEYMIRKKVPNRVLQSTITERNMLRNDHINCEKQTI